jgi:predicted nucleic acid-binding protein
MQEIDDIARKRAILFTIQARFTPQLQPVRETAIDKMIEQTLLLADPKEGLSLEEMQKQGIVCLGSERHAIAYRDLRRSLDRLVQKDRAQLHTRRETKKYRLCTEAREELLMIHKAAELRFNSVVKKLFKNAKGGPPLYRIPFLQCLCIIFLRLSENYVKVIKGDLKEHELLKTPSITSVLNQLRRNFLSIDFAEFENAVFSFFDERDPDYDAIKWNLAQNYYIAKALGLSSEVGFLSEELFGKAVFYLDTNVIIDALEPRALYHRSFKQLSDACTQLGIELKVLQITIDELRQALSNHRFLLEKSANQVPEQSASKVRGPFYEVYRQQLEEKGEVDLDSIFRSFESPMEKLRERYKVNLEDDPWFDEAALKPETNKYAERLRVRYAAVRGRPKGKKPSVHDALALQWIRRKQQETKKNIRFVTLDTSLPGFPLFGTGNGKDPIAITIDALIQWICPVAVQDATEEDFAAIFSEAIKYQVLPQEKIFELRDFLIFAEMQMACKELPPADVENCIQYIKKTAPDLDPFSPADREKLGYEISKFFADPSRQYKKELQRLEAESHERKKEYEGKYRSALGQLEKVKAESGELLEQRDIKIAELEKKISEREEADRIRVLKSSAKARLAAVISIFAGLELLLSYLVNKYAQGTNFLQKAQSCWGFFSLPVIVAIVLGWFIIGKERVVTLGRPFTKIFKAE